MRPAFFRAGFSWGFPCGELSGIFRLPDPGRAYADRSHQPRRGCRFDRGRARLVRRRRRRRAAGVSRNGTDWTDPQFGKEGEFYRAVCFGNGVYVAVGTFGGSNLFAATRDGIAWKTDKKDGQYSKYVRGLGFGAGTFLALGGDPGSVGSSSPFVVTSPDGLTWGDYLPIAGKNILRRFAWGRRDAQSGRRGRRPVRRRRRPRPPGRLPPTGCTGTTPPTSRPSTP